METMKKINIFLTILLIGIVSLSAQGANESAAAKKDDDGLTHITFWYSGTYSETNSIPDDWVGYQRLKDELGIDLEASSLPASEQDQVMKVRAAAAADALPDFFVTSRDVFLDLVKRGMVAEVGDLYELMPVRTKNQFDDDAKNFVTVDGKIYGFATPSSIDRNEGLLIREDWLKNLGLEVPKTLDDLYNVMYAFTYNDPDGNGKNDTYGYGAFIQTNNYEEYPGRRFEPLMGAFGVEGTWDLRESSFGLNIHKPEFYDFMVFLKKCIDDGLVDPNYMAYKKDDFRGAWKQGKFGIFREQYAAYSMQNNYIPFDKNFPDGGCIVVDPPIGKDGKSSVGPAVPSKRITCISTEAMEAGKGPKIAEFMEWLNTDGYQLCRNGVEGVNFVYDEAGNEIPVEGEMGYNGAIGCSYCQLFNMASNYNESSPSDRYIAPSGKQMDMHQVLVEMQSKKWTPQAGASSMPLPSSDLQTLYQQTLAEFLTGKRALTEANWDAFIKDFDQAGGLDWEKEGYEFAKANNYLQK